MRKVHTTRNPADALTKALPFSMIKDLCRRVNVVSDGDPLDEAIR